MWWPDSGSGSREKDTSSYVKRVSLQQYRCVKPLFAMQCTNLTLFNTTLEVQGLI